MRADRQYKAWKAAAASVVAVAFWLLVWQLGSVAMGQPLIFPGPVEVAGALLRCLGAGRFWTAVLWSTVRIVGSLLSAFALGVTLAALSYRFGGLRVLLRPPLAAVKATPVACVVVLLLIWLGAAHVSVAVVLLMAVPGFYFPALEGLDRADVRLREVFDVHGVCGIRRALAFIWPQMLPFLLAAGESVAGMAWKAGVAAELIGMPQGSIGERIYQCKLLLDTADLFAWTLAVIALSWACERLLLGALSASEGLCLSAALRRGGRSVPDAGDAVRFCGSGALDVPAPRGERALSCDGGAARPCGSATLGFPSFGGECPSLRGSEVACPRGGVRVEGLSVELGDTRILEGLDFSVPAGGRLCVMAPSGSGKTTLLRLLAGLVAPCAGMADAPGQSSMEFQEARLIERASALDNVLLFARDGVSCGEACELLAALLPGVSLDVPVCELSGGQRRRVELARALLAPGDRVLLDEPFAGLDAAAHIQAAEIVLGYLGGRSLIVATHDAHDADLLNAALLSLPVKIWDGSRI